MPDRLSTYRARRDPSKTPEPMGDQAPRGETEPPGGESKRRGGGRKKRSPSFVIQEHHARALHWDFRLERDGVLVSWALPKGLPVTPATNHLAVHTEDHPLEYASFEDEIPGGEYGGGRVSIWDRGHYELEKWSESEVMVVLHGRRASGRYVLFPTKDKNWIIHRMDPPPEGFEPLPEHVRPMLALAAPLPKSDEAWAYEFKWDGVRALVYVEGGRVRAYSRNDKELVSSFPELRDVGDFLGARSAVLDGEIVALDEKARPSFGRLQQRLHLGSQARVARAAERVPASFLAFDLLYLEGRLYMEAPYDERRELLESLELGGGSFATPPSVRDGTGIEVLRVADERGLEGVVAKRRASPYAPGQRNGDWLKVKIFLTQEVVIGGWTKGKGEREGSLGALLLGIPEGGRLVYVGKVGTGFSERARRELLAVLAPLAQPESPFTERLSPAETRLATFVRPALVGEVRYGEWTGDGHLRHPSWRGLRLDKAPADVVRETRADDD